MAKIRIQENWSHGECETCGWYSNTDVVVFVDEQEVFDDSFEDHFGPHYDREELLLKVLKERFNIEVEVTSNDV